MKNKAPRVKISDRDRAIFDFLWLWKVSTTAAIWKKFFSNTRSTDVAYNRLRRLKKAKYIDQARSEDGHHFWTLARNGYLITKERLPYVKEDGFRSEHVRHDHIVSALHLGEFLSKRPEEIAFTTEQQLRRYATESLPNWIPEVETHRPDGFTLVRHGKSSRVIALEVELNRKSVDDYRAISRYYDQYPQILDIVWVATNRSTASWIHHSLGKNQDPSSHHQFVLLDGFFQSGWDTKISVGNKKGKKIRNVILGEDSSIQHLLPVYSSSTWMTQYLLDTRIRIRKSATYEEDLKARFCN